MEEIKENTISDDKGGTPFDDGPRGGIKAIHIRSGRRINGIKIIYGDGEGEYHGGMGGNPSSAELEDGEGIIEVVAMEHETKGFGMEYLHFKTSKGRLIEFDTNGPPTQGNRKTFTAPPGYILGGIHGKKAGSLVTTIGVYWVPPSKPEPLKLKPPETLYGDKEEEKELDAKVYSPPWHTNLLICAFILLIESTFVPVWGRYRWAQDGGGPCTTWIGPWGHIITGEDCESGLVKHEYDFYCDLDIPNTDKIESLDRICKTGTRAGRIVFIGASLALLFGTFALFSKIKAWCNYDWKKNKKLIYASITFSILSLVCAGNSCIAWMLATDTMDAYLKATDNGDAGLQVGFFFQIIASTLILISFVCDVYALVNLEEDSESNEKTLTTPLIIDFV